MVGALVQIPLWMTFFFTLRGILGRTHDPHGFAQVRVRVRLRLRLRVRLRLRLRLRIRLRLRVRVRLTLLLTLTRAARSGSPTSRRPTRTTSCPSSRAAPSSRWPTWT